jgi:hypothetical protein
VNESTGQKTIREVPHEEIMAVIRQMQDGAGESQPIQFKRDPKTGALTPQ